MCMEFHPTSTVTKTIPGLLLPTAKRAPIEHLEHRHESLADLHYKCKRRHPNALIAIDFNVGNRAWNADEVSGTYDRVNAKKLVAIKEHLSKHQREITRPSNVVLGKSKPHLLD